MLRHRGGHRRRVVIGVVVHAAPHQFASVCSRDIDDQRPFGELPLVWIGLTTGAAPALLDWPPLAVESEVDAAHAAFDNERGLARRLGEPPLSERFPCGIAKLTAQHRGVESRMPARRGHVPDGERPQRRELDLVVHEYDIVVGPDNSGCQRDEHQTGQSTSSHGGDSTRPEQEKRAEGLESVVEMHHACLAALLVFFLAAEVLSQAPRFEVASIKPRPAGLTGVAGGTGGGSIGRQGERFVAVNSPLRDIIRYAYALEPFESIEGGPQWLDDRFDVAAVIPASATTPDALRAMVQTLLTDRFKLAVRMSAQEQPVYALTLARRDGRLGPGLKPSTTDCGEPRPQKPAPGTQPITAEEYAKLPACDMLYQPFRARLHGSARTMDDLAQLLARVPAVKAPVINRTSLTARFDFDLVYAPDRASPAPAGDAPPSLFVALEEQLGLKLESSRGQVRTLIVNHVERPTPD